MIISNFSIRYNLSPSYEYQEKPWLAHFKKERRVSFKGISWTLLLVSSIYNRLIKQRKKVTILYGTETGQSKRFAKLALNIFMSTFRCTILPLDHKNLYQNMRSGVFISITVIINPNKLFRLSDLNIFISSTFGSGEAPVMAKAFSQELTR